MTAEEFSEKEKKLMGFIKRVLPPRDNYVVYGVIIGSMSSGKTTLALTLASLFKRMHQNSECYITDVENMDIVISNLSNLQKKNIAIIFDDVSLVIHRYSKELRRIFTIRHPSGDPLTALDKNIFLLFNCHYVRSIAPFLRASPLRILTSISEAEIRAYANEYLFTVSSLWDYLYYVRKYPERFISLFSVRGSEHVVDVTNVTRNECKPIIF